MKPLTILRTLICAAVLPFGLAAAAAAAAAADFPSKPIKVIVGYSPGGAVDAIARSVGQQMSSLLGQSVVVENKPGAATNIAVKALIASPADGHTLLLAANALAVNPSLFQPAPYDLEHDLTPVALVGRVPVVFAVRAESGHHSLQQLVAAARSSPGGITFATPGNGSTPHLAMELFEHTAELKMRHVPYKGGAPAITDVLGGHVDMVAVNALEALPLAKSGKLRVLAVLSGQRSPMLPGVPTVAEVGWPGFEASVWYGFIAPAGTPGPIVSRLHEAVQKALESPDVRDRLAAAGGEALPGPTERFGELLRHETARYGKLIRDVGIQPD